MLTINKHRSIMLEVVKTLYEDTFLGPVLGFKGGTLLYMLYNLPRFSVDLDFDLLDATKESQVLSKLENILKHIGVIQELTNKRYTLFSLLNYEKGQQNLKIEISKRNLGSRYEVTNYLGVSLQTMVKEDIFANKLMALTTRKKPANRDVFDTWFLLKEHWDVNWELVEKKSLMKKEKFIKTCVTYLEHWLQEAILSGMGELLDNKTKEWAKKNLIKDTIFLLRAGYGV